MRIHAHIFAPILLAFCVGILGVVLRAAIPVAPVDNAFRDVIRFYRSLEPATRWDHKGFRAAARETQNSNIRETWAPY